MDIPNHAELLDRIETFCRRHDIAETRFGREAVSNPNFITGLRREPPVSPTLETLNRVRDFMARIAAEAATRAKLAAPLDPPGEQEEIELPFRSAPVTTATGASSLTSSLTNARPSPRAASPRSPSSCGPNQHDETTGPLPLLAGQTRAESHTPGAPPVLSDRET